MTNRKDNLRPIFRNNMLLLRLFGWAFLVLSPVLVPIVLLMDDDVRSAIASYFREVTAAAYGKFE